MSRVKTVFMGSDPIALPTLEVLVGPLAHTLELVALFTQPDRRTGRGKKTTPNALKTWAIGKRIDVHQPEKMDKQSVQWFENSGCGLVLVMAYGHLIPKSILAQPTFGCFNLHASLLPKLRGASPIETAIVTGETLTGVTLMQMVPSLDSGPIAASEPCSISKDQTAWQLRQNLAQCAAILTLHQVPRLLDPDTVLAPQDESQASYCRLLDKADGWLDFGLSAQETINHIRGFQPWPGALLEHRDQTLKVGNARVADSPPVDAPAGTLLRVDKCLYIKCSDSWVELLEMQKPGGKMLPVRDFLNGYPMDPATQLKFPKRYPLTAPRYFKKPPLA
jgi:methionyl-tRNA formyltransferase